MKVKNLSKTSRNWKSLTQVRHVTQNKNNNNYNVNDNNRSNKGKPFCEKAKFKNTDGKALHN